MRRLAIPLVLAALAASVAGCWYGYDYDQRGGRAIADHIRGLHSPLVVQVDYRAGDSIDPSTIDIFLKPGVETSDAQAFICSIALPYAEAADPPDSLSIVALNGAAEIIASDSECR